MMGSDDLFKKTKKRRKEKVRNIREKFWFYCEGETEQQYLHGMRREKKVPKELWCIQTTNGDPKHLYETAIKEYHKETKLDKPTAIYLLIDRDDHEHFQQVLIKSKFISHRSRGKVPIKIIASYPCWEIWVLCHFETSQKPWVRKGTQSACDCLISKIKDSYPKYEKNDPHLFSNLRSNLDTAITNAQRLRVLHELNPAHNPETDDPNPSTDMDKLLEDFSF